MLCSALKKPSEKAMSAAVYCRKSTAQNGIDEDQKSSFHS
jgi:hypothetical protein